MARGTKGINNPTPQPATLSPGQMKTAIDRLEKRVAELRILDHNIFSSGSDPNLREIETRIEQTLSQIFGPDSHEYRQLFSATEIDATSYSINLGGYSAGPSVTEIREGIQRGRDRAIALLQSAADSLREVLEHSVDTCAAPPVSARRTGGPVFIVHGRDEPSKLKAARFVERAGLTPMILSELPNEGRTLIEKLEHYGDQAGYAVVLLTADDVGGLDTAALQPRARQNVIAELGWFTARLTRKRVTVLYAPGVEIPSDFDGVAYVELDSRGAWQGELGRELTAAGYAIDWGRVMSGA
jgi:predicted nucleotide-binding protein